jgi:membrane-bound serine protease (ClpP class)
LLPVNYIGILLILLALGLFVAEVTVQGFGILGAGGTVAMLLGILFLVDSPFPELRISFGLALAVAIPFALIAILLLHLTVKSVRLKVTTGTRGMVGSFGVAQTPIEADEGRVLVLGERWKAVSATSIPQGARVKVVGAKNLVLVVEPYAGSGVSLAMATEEEG